MKECIHDLENLEDLEVCYFCYNTMEYKRCTISKDLGNNQVLTYIIKDNKCIFDVLDKSKIIFDKEILEMNQQRENLKNQINEYHAIIENIKDEIKQLDKNIISWERNNK